MPEVKFKPSYHEYPIDSLIHSQRRKVYILIGLSSFVFCASVVFLACLIKNRCAAQRDYSRLYSSLGEHEKARKFRLIQHCRQEPLINLSVVHFSHKRIGNEDWTDKSGLLTSSEDQRSCRFRVWGSDDKSTRKPIGTIFGVRDKLSKSGGINTLNKHRSTMICSKLIRSFHQV